MRKIKKYSLAIIDLIKEYEYSGTKINAVVSTDTLHHHYIVFKNGWYDTNSYILRFTLYFHIKPDGKVWILANATEDDVAEALVKRGVAKSDIVLGFLPESVRPYSDYAAA